MKDMNFILLMPQESFVGLLVWTPQDGKVGHFSKKKSKTLKNVPFLQALKTYFSYFFVQNAVIQRQIEISHETNCKWLLS